MGITQHGSDNATSTGDNTQKEQPRYTTNSGGQTNSAPSPRAGFLSFANKIGIDKVDKTVAPFLEKVLETIQGVLPEVTMIRMERMSNAYVFKYEGTDGNLTCFGLMFSSTAAPKLAKYQPMSTRLSLMLREMKENNPDRNVRMADARIVLANYEAEMSRTEEMANTIVSVLQVTAILDYRNATADYLQGSEFVLDWSLSEAKNTERMLSPQGVPPRMDIGMTLKVKIRNDFGGTGAYRDIDTEYRTVGVIGGYVDIRDKEPVQQADGKIYPMYRPVVNITVCSAIVPLEGIAMMLIASFAPTIYNSKHWAKQWMSFGDNQPNVGMLEEDPDRRGFPLLVKNTEDLTNFVDGYFAPPVLAYQFQDGADSIPGMVRMAVTDGAMKAHFINRLTHFLGAPEENVGSQVLSAVIDYRFDGAYGDPSGVLHDTRNVDYLYLAAHLGYGAVDGDMRRIMLQNADDPVERARVVDSATGGFSSLYLTSVAAINPQFIRWFIEKMDAKGIVVTDPDSRLEARPLGSMLSGFGSSANMASFVTTGQQRQGLGLSSIWS